MSGELDELEQQLDDQPKAQCHKCREFADHYTVHIVTRVPLRWHCHRCDRSWSMSSYDAGWVEGHAGHYRFGRGEHYDKGYLSGVHSTRLGNRG